MFKKESRYITRGANEKLDLRLIRDFKEQSNKLFRKDKYLCTFNRLSST